MDVLHNLDSSVYRYPFVNALQGETSTLVDEVQLWKNILQVGVLNGREAIFFTQQLFSPWGVNSPRVGYRVYTHTHTHNRRANMAGLGAWYADGFIKQQTIGMWKNNIFHNSSNDDATAIPMTEQMPLT